MSQAFFAIAGTIVGVLGTIVANVATNLINAKREDAKAWQETFRSVVSELTSEVLNMRGLSHRIREYPEDKDLRLAIQRSFTRVQTLRRTLQLISKSRATQEASDLVNHYVYWVWRIARGDGGLADFDMAEESTNLWLRKLYTEVRKELGLGASDLYERPIEGYPIPMAREKKVAEGQAYASEIKDQQAGA
jgi:hypothetical protein